MTESSHRNFKDRLFGQFALIGKAVASPQRLELLELLAQGARTVEAISKDSELSIANASQHLQVLRQAGLVESQKRGLFVEYRLAGPEIFALCKALLKSATRNSNASYVNTSARDLKPRWSAWRSCLNVRVKTASSFWIRGHQMSSRRATSLAPSRFRWRTWKNVFASYPGAKSTSRIAEDLIVFMLIAPSNFCVPMAAAPGACSKDFRSGKPLDFLWKPKSPWRR